MKSEQQIRNKLIRRLPNLTDAELEEWREQCVSGDSEFWPEWLGPEVAKELARRAA